MSIPTIKISQEGAVGRNLEPTDLFYISEVDGSSPTGYSSKSITGQEIIDGVGSSGAMGKNFSQTQWKTTIPVGISIPNGTDLNLLSLFDNLADKYTDGTTAYNEYNITPPETYIPLTFTGTGGSGEVKIDGNDYNTTFNISEDNTAFEFYNTTILPAPFSLVYPGGNVVWLIYTGPAPTVLYTNTGGDLNVAFGAIANTHPCIKIPYVGEPYEGQRLTHNSRVAINISTGSLQVLELTFRRCTDDSIIASGTTIHRNQDITGQLASFLSYTFGELDAFVQAGFYVNIRNDSGATIDLEGELDFLIINNFQENVIFP